MRKRHWGITLSFLIIVLIPLLAVGSYLTMRSTDQYASLTGFSVRSEEVPSPSELLGGLSQFVGGSSGGGETDMLYEFLQSQDLVSAIDEKLDLRTHYTAPYENDPIFSLKPGGTIEDLVDYWGRIVRISYDQGTGLISLRVNAFTPEMARDLTEAVLAESQTLVDDLNATARSDALKYAEADLVQALVRVKDARQAMAEYRTRTQIVDPESDLQGRMGVLAGLQQQLAQALIEHDVIAQESSPSDPRISQAKRRIEVIRERIADERRTFAEDEDAGNGDSYPTLLAEYERLMVDLEYSEQAYSASLAGLDVARANAARRTRYLATYIRPTLPQKSEYPQRWNIFGLSALFLLLIWSISALMFYAIRDRK